jgi:hypothetical protein
MMYHAFISFLIFNEAICIITLMVDSDMLNIMEAALLILGFVAIGVLLALAI